MSFVGTKRKWKEIAIDGAKTGKARELGIMGIEVVEVDVVKKGKGERIKSETESAKNSPKRKRKPRKENVKVEQKMPVGGAEQDEGVGAKNQQEAENEVGQKRKKRKRKGNKNDKAQPANGSSEVVDNQNSDLDMMPVGEAEGDGGVGAKNKRKAENEVGQKRKRKRKKKGNKHNKAQPANGSSEVVDDQNSDLDMMPVGGAEEDGGIGAKNMRKAENEVSQKRKRKRKRKGNKNDKAQPANGLSEVVDNQNSDLDMTPVGRAEEDGGIGTKNKRKAENEVGQKRKKKRKKKGNKNNKAQPAEGSSGVANDQNSDLDMTAWDGLFVPDLVQRALRHQGFSQPTDIQRAVLPAAIKGRMDVLGAAETGSGKTLAFAIPIIHGILHDRRREEEEEEESLADEESERELISDEEFEDMSDEEGTEGGCVKVVNDVAFDFVDDGEFFAPPIELFEAAKESRGKRLRALVLTPTRELAMQVKAHMERAASFTDLSVAVVVGGMSSQKQERVLGYGPEIVVATPGRLWDLIEEGNPHLATVTDLDYLAVDETDRMTEKGHFEELKQLLDLINRDEAKMRKRQNFVFSATLSLVHDLPKHLIGKKRAKAVTAEEKLEQVMSAIGVKEKSRRKVVDLTSKLGTAKSLTESRIHCDLSEKDIYLYYFTQMHPGRTLVFCNSIDCVRRLVNLLSLLRCRPLGLHAQMHQKQRLKNLDRFVADPAALLIASDVAARGLDINNVEHVIHYQVPKTSESYVHRSGRTARASKEGLSVIMIDSSESLGYKKICHTLKRVEELPLFPVDGSIYSSAKARMTKARELDKLKLGARKTDAEKSWRRRAAEEAELVLSDSDADSEGAEEGGGKTRVKAAERQRIAQKQTELDALLDEPLASAGFSGKYPTKTGKLEMPETGKSSRSAVSALKEDAERNKELLNAGKRVSTKRRFKKKKTKMSME